jgi:arabinofuranosyltransferase
MLSVTVLSQRKPFIAARCPITSPAIDRIGWVTYRASIMAAKRLHAREEPESAPRSRRWAFAAGSLLIVAGALSAVLYYRMTGGDGYPLDDSWIHLAFARNVATGLCFGVTPGESTPGATSPLWVLLLAAGYVFGATHTIWPWALDAGVLAAAGILAAWLVHSLPYRPANEQPRRDAFYGLRSALCGLAIVLSAPLVWSAAGAMEVPLFCALIIGSLLAFAQANEARWRSAVLWGGLAGLAALARPEGLLMVVILPAVLLLYRRRAGIRSASVGLAVGVLVYLPSVVFCLTKTGRVFPNTFYAKTTALVSGAPSWQFMAHVLVFLYYNTLEALALMLLGLILAAILGGRRCLPKAVLAALAFTIGLPTAYASMGRTTLFAGFAGNFGRYLYPMIPLAIILGFWAMNQWAGMVRRTWAGLVAFVLALVAVAHGGIVTRQQADFYAHNVRDINRMQVRIAERLKATLPANSLVASNDVGAIAYLTELRVLDLVGLTSTEVLDALRAAGPSEEKRAQALVAILRERRPAALVVFPQWYPGVLRALGRRLETLLVCDNPQNITSGGNPLVAFRIHWER